MKHGEEPHCDAYGASESFFGILVSDQRHAHAMKRETADMVPERQACRATEALETAPPGSQVRYSAVSSDCRALRCYYILHLLHVRSSDLQLRLAYCMFLRMF